MSVDVRRVSVCMLCAHLVGTVLHGSDGAIDLVADGVAVLGLLLVGLALGLLGVAGDLVGGPVDVVLDGVDGGLDEAPGRWCQLRILRSGSWPWGRMNGVLTRPVRWC